ncbi:MAG TPA: KEOPS complex subunit Pcc1 [archaeon]|nr:KEOPS complex subunit Pcc1 [archaeon]
MVLAQKSFEFPSEFAAKCACRSIGVELKNTYEKRSKTRIQTNKNVVLLKIDASDEFAANASLHSYSHLLGLCREISLISGG